MNTADPTPITDPRSTLERLRAHPGQLIETAQTPCRQVVHRTDAPDLDQE
ncbi:hypothetical protein [Nocardia sp. BMG111209]|nr:hypothetical protein [Nocardia sp. BMG111209]